MSDEFNIIEEKTLAEKKAEKFNRDFARMMDAERIGKLIKSEFADIDVIMGILLQTKGMLRINHDVADDIEEYLEDMLTISQEMVECLNAKTLKRRKERKNE